MGSLLLLHLQVVCRHSCLLLIEESSGTIIVEIVVTGARSDASRDDSITTVLVGHRVAAVIVKLFVFTVVRLRVGFLKLGRGLDATSGMTLITRVRRRLKILLALDCAGSLDLKGRCDAHFLILAIY